MTAKVLFVSMVLLASTPTLVSSTCDVDMVQVANTLCDNKGSQMNGYSAATCQSYCTTTDGCVAVSFGKYSGHCWQCDDTEYGAPLTSSQVLADTYYCPTAPTTTTPTEQQPPPMHTRH